MLDSKEYIFRKSKFDGIYLILILVLTTLVDISESSINYVELLGKDPRISEDGRLSFTELAAKYGHPAEEHSVTTEDGYILGLFRLPGDVTRPVLLVHGNTVDADCFIVRGNTSLAITLANKGYDVWVISLRGTIYSQRHLTIDPVKEPLKFYNFSHYEQGIYDLPATIDYVLGETGQTKVLSVGYSMGTTVFYVLGAEKPEYNDKVKAQISLAPICFTKNQKGAQRLVFTVGGLVNPNFLLSDGSAEVLGRNQASTYLYQTACLKGPVAYQVCVKDGIFKNFGPDSEGFEPEFMPTFFGHYPGGSTEKQVLYSIQMLKSGEFARFDYGTMKNLAAYHSIEPPKFDLSKVTMKIALLVGSMDYLSTVKDVDRLAGELPNVIHHQVLPYNHFDFAYGKQMNETLYPTLLELVEKYI